MRRVLTKPATTPQARRQAALQFSRAVAREQPDMARRAVISLPELADLVLIDDHRITILDPPRLDAIFAAIMKKALQHDADEDAADALAHPRAATHQQRRRRPLLSILTKLWAPYAVRTYLATVIDGSGTHLDRDDTKAAALGQYWVATFERRATSASVSRAVTAADARPLPYGPIPTATTFAGAFRRARPSAPGPDGIPATAWAACGHEGGMVMQSLFIHLTTRAATPPSLHSGIMVFLPKPTGEAIRDAEWQAARTASECRPLTLRNCDAKGIAAIVAYRARDGLRAWTHESQRRFVKGRQAIDNITDVDTRARILTAIASDDVLDDDAIDLLRDAPTTDDGDHSDA